MKYFVYCRKSQESDDRQTLSLESQQQEVDQLIASESVEIVDTYVEAFSAKSPGRPLFNEMLDRIERGEADGIIAWHPDRLARNSMDGGRIIYLLDQGKLNDMKFCSYSFENSSQGKFMLNIIFGYSKYYVDSLSENVKRGLRTKLKKGWLPNRPPLGYLNCKNTGEIIVDFEHFKAVRGMFELLLSGKHSVASIHRIVSLDWAYKTPVRKRIGGKSPSFSGIHRILANPFYTGYIKWKGKIYDGAHTPVISKSEFKQVQVILGLAPKTRPQKYEFTYAGLLTCGSCGKAITAERKRKPSGLEYIYYHCTRVHTSPKCTQPSIEEKQLTVQIKAILKQIYLPKKIADWLLHQIENSFKGFDQGQENNLKRHDRAVAQLEQQISTLTDLRVRDMLTDQEFETKRNLLRLEFDAAVEKRDKIQSQKITFEPVRFLILLCNKAESWFSIADQPTKQKLLRIICSNLQLVDKKVIFEAAKPFMEIHDLGESLIQRGEVDVVRTQIYISDDEIEKMENLLDNLAHQGMWPDV
ncbi:MAG: recombinase family protein [Rhizobiales bacterium]|nr:recombinase family protein [Hyphomicrobiales bacterium]NRB15097.1 recombinase family protein [Hyphomicrobiales bacterium]